VASGANGACHQPGVLRVRNSRSKTRAFYNKISGVYDLLAERSEMPIARMGLEMLAPQPGEKILEIGFGTGRTLADLAEAVGTDGRVFGIDLSDGMVEQATARLRRKGVEGLVELVCGDAAALPYGAERLDGVFMSFTLELFDTPEIPVVLAECRRVLRQGGRSLVVGLSRVRPDSLMTGIYEWTHRHFPNLLDCRPILVRRALEDAGFQIRGERVETMWMPVEIVLGVKE